MTFSHHVALSSVCGIVYCRITTGALELLLSLHFTENKYEGILGIFFSMYCESFVTELHKQKKKSHDKI